MHASTKQLLSLRDREPIAADVQQHVAGCEQCQRQLQQLRSVRDALQRLSMVKNVGTKADGEIDFAAKWEGVKQGAQRRRYRRQRLGQWAVAAGVAVLAVLTLPLINVDTNSGNVDGPESTADIQRQQDQLIARNAQLENALRELPRPPKVMRGGTAYAIASFEDQIALVDYQLSYGEELGINETESVSLLRSRAELLDSLYKVRYTQAIASLASY